jgi:hypothetical protein
VARKPAEAGEEEAVKEIAMNILLYASGAIGLFSIGIIPLRVAQLWHRWLKGLPDRARSMLHLTLLAGVPTLAVLWLHMVVFFKVVRCLTSVRCGAGVASGWLYLAVLGAVYVLVEMALLFVRRVTSDR